MKHDKERTERFEPISLELPLYQDFHFEEEKEVEEEKVERGVWTIDI